MVRTAGLEPAQYYYRGILSPLRLPVSPCPPMIAIGWLGVTEERPIRQVRVLLLNHNPETIRALRLRFGRLSLETTHGIVSCLQSTHRSSPLMVLGNRCLIGKAHIPGEIDPRILRHLGNECIDQRAA